MSYNRFFNQTSNVLVRLSDGTVLMAFDAYGRMNKFPKSTAQDPALKSHFTLIETLKPSTDFYALSVAQRLHELLHPSAFSKKPNKDHPLSGIFDARAVLCVKIEGGCALPAFEQNGFLVRYPETMKHDPLLGQHLKRVDNGRLPYAFSVAVELEEAIRNTPPWQTRQSPVEEKKMRKVKGKETRKIPHETRNPDGSIRGMELV